MPLLFQTLRQQTAGTLRLLYGIDESQLAGYPGVSSSKLFFFLCHVSKHWSTFTVYVTANYLGLDTLFRVYIYIYGQKILLYFLDILESGRLFTQVGSYNNGENIYTEVFCATYAYFLAYFLRYSLFVFLSKSVFPHLFCTFPRLEISFFLLQ